jgi:hypothetical protein
VDACREDVYRGGEGQTGGHGEGATPLLLSLIGADFAGRGGASGGREREVIASGRKRRIVSMAMAVLELGRVIVLDVSVLMSCVTCPI